LFSHAADIFLNTAERFLLVCSSITQAVSEHQKLNYLIFAAPRILQTTKKSTDCWLHMNKIHKSFTHAVVSKTDSSEVQRDLCSWKRFPTGFDIL